jgi:hypothetical protein
LVNLHLQKITPKHLRYDNGGCCLPRKTLARHFIPRLKRCLFNRRVFLGIKEATKTRIPSSFKTQKIKQIPKDAIVFSD